MWSPRLHPNLRFRLRTQNHNSYRYSYPLLQVCTRFFVDETLMLSVKDACKLCATNVLSDAVLLWSEVCVACHSVWLPRICTEPWSWYDCLWYLGINLGSIWDQWVCSQLFSGPKWYRKWYRNCYLIPKLPLGGRRHFKSVKGPGWIDLEVKTRQANFCFMTSMWCVFVKCFKWGKMYDVMNYYVWCDVCEIMQAWRSAEDLLPCGVCHAQFHTVSPASCSTHGFGGGAIFQIETKSAGAWPWQWSHLALFHTLLG